MIFCWLAHKYLLSYYITAKISSTQYLDFFSAGSTILDAATDVISNLFDLELNHNK